MSWTLKAGIYRITNAINNKCYIGSSIDVNRRLIQHKSDLKHSRNKYLKNAEDKYGLDKFNFEILIYCDPFLCLIFEQICIDYFKPEYNINPTAGNCTGKIQSEVTKEKIRISLLGHARSEETKTKIRQSLLGHIQPESTKIKIGNSLRNKPWSEKRRRACRG